MAGAHPNNPARRAVGKIAIRRGRLLATTGTVDELGPGPGPGLGVDCGELTVVWARDVRECDVRECDVRERDVRECDEPHPATAKTDHTTTAAPPKRLEVRRHVATGQVLQANLGCTWAVAGSPITIASVPAEVTTDLSMLERLARPGGRRLPGPALKTPITRGKQTSARARIAQVVSDVVAAGRRATPLASAACATAGATALTTARLNTLGIM
jgi:hypothetical protein